MYVRGAEEEELPSSLEEDWAAKKPLFPPEPFRLENGRTAL